MKRDKNHLIVFFTNIVKDFESCDYLSDYEEGLLYDYKIALEEIKDLEV